MPPEYQCRNCGIMYKETMPRCFTCSQEGTVKRRTVDTWEAMYRFWDDQVSKEAAGSAGAALGEELLRLAREQLDKRRPRRRATGNPPRKIQKKRYVTSKPAKIKQPAGTVQCSSDPIRISRPRLIP